jgi:serine/threonine protein kinase
MTENNNISKNVKFRELTAKSTLYNGKYIIEKVLGMGGFGITYYARHATLYKYYAIKEFFINGFCIRNTQTREVHLQSIADEEYERYKKRFIEEAQTLSKLDHPNIVKIIDIFDENNTSYIVMPFVEGITLQQLINQKSKLDYESAINYIAQISEAIGYIHECNPPILHRDISPDNVIISPDNKIVLIDFGSAREFVHDKTQNQTAILKKGYAPLEQYSVTSRKGAYTDIYSLGAVFYFVLTGQKPMDATERTMMEMPEPKDLEISIPEDANRTIQKAMSLKPENRHQNIQEFMDDLLGRNQITVTKKRKAKFIWMGVILLFVFIAILSYFFIYKVNTEKENITESLEEVADSIPSKTSIDNSEKVPVDIPKKSADDDSNKKNEQNKKIVESNKTVDKPEEKKENEEQDRANDKLKTEEQLQQKIKELISKANDAFDNSKYDEAFELYKETKKTGSNDNTGYNNFLKKAKDMIEIDGYDQSVEYMLLKAKELKDTKEVNELISLSQTLKETISHANDAFNSAQYEKAFGLYKEAKKSGSNDNTGYHNFLKKAKDMIIKTGYSAIVENMLRKAKELNDTKEVNELITKYKINN